MQGFLLTNFRCQTVQEIDMLCVRFRCCLAIVLVAAALSCKSHSDVEEPVTDKLSAPAYVSQADQLYAQRDDLTRLQQGIVLLRQAITADPGSYDAAWRLAKFDYYMAKHTDNGASDNALREGIQAGKTAVQLQGGKPEGHFWLGANYGGSLESDSIAAPSSIDDVRKEMETVLTINQGYQDGSAYMVLGL